MSSMPPPPPPGPPPPPYGGPPQPPMGYVPYGQATTPQNLAGFGSRLGARLLDGIIYGAIGAVFAIPAWVLASRAVADCDRIRKPGSVEIRCAAGQVKGGLLAGAIGIGAIGFIIVAILYLSALAKSGQTFGRKIVGIKVVATGTGAAPGWGKAIGRTLVAQTISGWACFLGYLWMLWDPQKQTWHDKMAGTYVVTVN